MNCHKSINFIYVHGILYINENGRNSQQCKLLPQEHYRKAHTKEQYEVQEQPEKNVLFRKSKLHSKSKE